ncbi:hypothetical protein GMORB2_7045 [Geosmithia morbida]|uniref:Uncharacterized protein n=1 Tax=Geosmithia morbida TaxID=1094350 RepID=A0A9P4YTC5_9HYPO|nr:uncharacterized protein GMORB2_7045 [Geosmithia morbida]KAF4122738.1 hypothetical protein GMORB2_7045 [Geosmithia morbida]
MGFLDSLLAGCAVEERGSRAVKPPLPSLIASPGLNETSLEIQTPHVIAGAFIAAFAAAVADRLGNQLLAHYYLTGQRIVINLDRVIDGLIADFTREFWDELWDFYYASNAQHARQLSLLFRGPIRQLIMILLGPELARCILDIIGPGLSRRINSWSQSAGAGVPLEMSVQLIMRWWALEYPSHSPGGSPDEIARTICSRTVAGTSFKTLITRIKKVLYTPHHVQKHLIDSAAWHILMRRPFRPPSDGFHVWQLRLECDPRQRIADCGGSTAHIGSLPVIVGTVNECYPTTIAEYSARNWPRCGSILMGCLGEALAKATTPAHTMHEQETGGMSLWDGGYSAAAMSHGLRAIHVEVEAAFIRLTVCARAPAMIELMRQVAWTCAALSSSPFPDALSECRLQVSDWAYTDDATSVSCSLAHHEVAPEQGSAWLQQRRGAVVVPGFPIEEDRIYHFQPNMI